MNRKVIFVALALAVQATPIQRLYAQQPLPDVGSYSEDARTARLATLREKYRINLSDTERELLVSRCTQAQTKLSLVSTKLVATYSQRTTTYNGVISSLTNLKSLVFARQVDASNLDLLIVEYQQKQVAFNDAVAKYQTALDDSIGVDCRTKPEEFRASVEGVREARKVVVGASTDIQEATKSNLKNAFDTLKLRIEAGAKIDGK